MSFGPPDDTALDPKIAEAHAAEEEAAAEAHAAEEEAAAEAHAAEAEAAAKAHAVAEEHATSERAALVSAATEVYECCRQELLAATEAHKKMAEQLNEL